MKSSRLKFGLLLLMGFCAVLYIVFTDSVMPWNRRDAIATTLQWGGLAAIPLEAYNIAVETEGGMFTRKFLVRFECSPTALDKWISESKRLRSNRAEAKGEKKLYSVYPGEGNAFGGTVEVEGTQVEIAMSWS